MAIGRFKLSFTTEESKIPSLVCQAPSDSETVEEVADTCLSYTVYLKKPFPTKILNMYRLKRTGEICHKFSKSSNWPIK